MVRFRSACLHQSRNYPDPLTGKYTENLKEKDRDPLQLWRTLQERRTNSLPKPGRFPAASPRQAYGVVHLPRVWTRVDRKEIFQDGTGIRLTAFDERWNGETADNSKPATRVFNVLAGSMTVDVNNESYDLNAGDTMVVFPLTIYRLRSSGRFLAEGLTLNCS